MPAASIDDRRARGAWYTPTALVDHLLDRVLEPVLAARSTVKGLRVLDPACGDGRFLVAAADRIVRRFGVDRAGAASCCVGVELDPGAAGEAAEAVGDTAEIIVGDATAMLDHHAAGFDVVVGNPPFLTPLRRRTASHQRRWSGGAYTDAAAVFLELALGVARPDRGRVGLVLPSSVLAARDAAAVREGALARARLASLWWAGEAVFDAQVDTCVATFVRGEEQGLVERWHGPGFVPMGAARVPQGTSTWGPLIADAAGIPPVHWTPGGGTLGDLAGATADFRDQYYGLVGAVRDEGDGPPLVTAGLIDPNRCRWGERAVTFARQRYAAPRVELGSLAEPMQAWAARRLVPKVVVATQTRVIEAAVDEAGAWLPSVPVISVIPRRAGDLWRVAAVLAAPAVSAWAAATYLGAGMSGCALKLSARQVLGVPVPAQPWDAAAAALRAGDLHGCAALMQDAYGVDDPAVLDWWRAHLSRR